MTITDPTDLERDYRTAIADAEALQRRLSAMNKDDPQREAVKSELAAAVERGRAAKEATKQLTARRNFAGLGSPLHLACIERLPEDVVAELEVEAMAILTERERMAAQRRALKAAATPQAAPPTTPAEPPARPPPRTLVAQAPEVYRSVSRASTSRLVASAPPTPRPSPPLRAPSRGREVADAFREAGRR